MWTPGSGGSGGGGAGGSGDVVGPASSTDNALSRFDGAGGKTIQNSLVVVNDAGGVSGLTSLATAGVAIGPATIAISSGGDSKARTGATGMDLANDVQVRWYDDTDIASGSADVGLERAAAGALQGTDGGAGSLTSFRLTPTVGIFQGAGSPEGAVAAGIGSLYLRTDGGLLTSLYVKEGGAATSSGWAAK
jgi:hypothetical protein